MSVHAALGVPRAAVHGPVHAATLTKGHHCHPA